MLIDAIKVYQKGTWLGRRRADIILNTFQYVSNQPLHRASRWTFHCQEFSSNLWI